MDKRIYKTDELMALPDWECDLDELIENLQRIYDKYKNKYKKIYVDKDYYIDYDGSSDETFTLMGDRLENNEEFKIRLDKNEKEREKEKKQTKKQMK